MDQVVVQSQGDALPGQRGSDLQEPAAEGDQSDRGRSGEQHAVAGVTGRNAQRGGSQCVFPVPGVAHLDVGLGLVVEPQRPCAPLEPREHQGHVHAVIPTG